MPDDTLPRYWTPAFVEKFVEALNSSTRFQKAARSFSQTIVLRCLDTPDKKDCVSKYTFVKGRCTEHSFTAEDAPSPSVRDEAFNKREMMARTTAPYSVWTKLDRGEMNVAQALVSPDYNIEGSKLKIMRYIGVFTALGDVASSVDKRYE